MLFICTKNEFKASIWERIDLEFELRNLFVVTFSAILRVSCGKLVLSCGGNEGTQ